MPLGGGSRVHGRTYGGGRACEFIDGICEKEKKGIEGVRVFATDRDIVL